MASKSESGMAVIIGRFEELINKYKSMGPKYNPTHPSLTLANLLKTHGDTKLAVSKCIKLEEIEHKAIADRQDAFKKLNGLVLQALSILEGNRPPQKYIDNARSILKDIRGERVGEKKENSISVSQLSFMNRAQFFEQLIECLEGSGVYNANEPDLQIAGLKAYHASLVQLNTKVIEASEALDKERLVRNPLMKTLVALADDSKSYAKGVLANNSPEFMEIRKIYFPKRN